jgi:hypothetical protein
MGELFGDAAGSKCTTAPPVESLFNMLFAKRTPFSTVFVRFRTSHPLVSAQRPITRRLFFNVNLGYRVFVVMRSYFAMGGVAWIYLWTNYSVVLQSVSAHRQRPSGLCSAGCFRKEMPGL